MATTTYDVVEYPSGVFDQTHPARLAAIARLHGIPAPSPARCRLLEIGAADGGNLLPLALAYPRSEFVGIDLSQVAVDKGRAAVAALGATNLTLLAEDLCQLPDSLGPFDYILAHGVFSWVPDAVRDGLLDLCQKMLTPNGVAYVSYNAMPGGLVSEMVAGMMRYHVRDMPDPRQRLDQARVLMRIVNDGSNVPGPLGEVLKHETRRVFEQFSDQLLFHDDLEEQNRRYYFHEFMAHAGRFGLQFLAEADYHEMTDAAFPSSAAEMLAALGKSDRVAAEQYRDFLCLRRFRQTLLVRADREVAVPARIGVLPELTICALPLKTEMTDPDFSPGVPIRFETMKGSVVTLDHPVAKAVVWELAKRPPVPAAVAEVIAAAATRLGRTPAALTEVDRTNALKTLFQVFSVGMAHLAVDPPRYVTTPGPRPKLDPLARYQVESGREFITTLRHGVVRLDTELTRQLALACDGTRDRAAILDRILTWATERPPTPGQHPESMDQLRRRLGDELEGGLRSMAGLALLVE